MEEIQKMPDYRSVWTGKNQGFIKAVNLGLTLVNDVWKTDSEYVVICNNDIEVTHGWLDRMISVMERDDKVCAVGPITSECKSWQSYLNANQVTKEFQIPEGFADLDTEERGDKLEYAYGDLYRRCWMLAFFCVVFRKDVFQKIGNLDEAFGAGYGDDDDFCKRINDNGMKCAVSWGSYVYHNHRTTFGSKFGDDEVAAMQAKAHDIYKGKHGESAHV
jgi:GT2 family glycosyltransferase